MPYSLNSERFLNYDGTFSFSVPGLLQLLVNTKRQRIGLYPPIFLYV